MSEYSSFIYVNRSTLGPYICGYETLFYLRARENLDVRKQEIKSIQNSEGTTLLMTILHLTVTVTADL
jgi:hypothetical protein